MASTRLRLLYVVLRNGSRTRFNDQTNANAPRQSHRGAPRPVFQTTSVKLGRSSVNTIEILEGLQPGDRVILSDMSPWENNNRVKLN